MMRTRFGLGVVGMAMVGMVGCGGGGGGSSSGNATAAVGSTGNTATPAPTTSMGTTGIPTMGMNRPTAAAIDPARGFAVLDTPINIIGSQLTLVTGAALIADVGTAVAPIDSWVATSDSLASAVVPAGAPEGLYRLQFDTAMGTVQTTTLYEVMPTPPAPTVLSLTPAVGFNDRDHVIVIEGTDFVAGASVTVSGAPISSVTVLSSTEILATIPAGVPAGMSDVEVSTIGGDSGAAGPQWEAYNLADPDQPGYYKASYRDARMTGAAGDTVDMRYYYPALEDGAYKAVDPNGGPYPSVVLNHAFRPPLFTFGVSYRGYDAIANRLASFGYVVIVPDQSTNNNIFGSGQSNAERDADDTLAAIDYLEAANFDANHVLVGLIDTTKVGLVGHSRGGNAALMAGAEEVTARGTMTRVKAIVTYSAPVFSDRDHSNRLTFGDYSSLPALFLSGSRDPIARPQDVNLLYDAAGTPSQLLEVEGANHSQWKDSDSEITGDSSAAIAQGDQHEVANRYTVAWLNAYVKGLDTVMADYIGAGAEVSNDARLADVQSR